jgi:hypothetical protein
MIHWPWQKPRITDADAVKFLDTLHPEAATRVELPCTPDWMAAFGRVPQTRLLDSGDCASPTKFLLTLSSVKKVGIQSFIVTYEGETIGIIETNKFPSLFVSLVSALGGMAWVEGAREKEIIVLTIPETARCKEFLEELE